MIDESGQFYTPLSSALKASERVQILFGTTHRVREISVNNLEKLLTQSGQPLNNQTKKTLNSMRRYAKFGAKISFPLPQDPRNSLSKKSLGGKCKELRQQMLQMES